MQFSLDDIVNRVENAPTWDERVEEIRRVPELFGQAQHQTVYAAIAGRLYRPHLAAQFAYVQWRKEYQLEQLEDAYTQAFELTDGFASVDSASLDRILQQAPQTIRVFRLIVGYTTSEFAVAASQVAARNNTSVIRKGRIEAMETGIAAPATVTYAIAETIHLLMTGQMWEIATGDFRSKLEKPDAEAGWETVHFEHCWMPLAPFAATFWRYL